MRAMEASSRVAWCTAGTCCFPKVLLGFGVKHQLRCFSAGDAAWSSTKVAGVIMNAAFEAWCASSPFFYNRFAVLAHNPVAGTWATAAFGPSTSVEIHRAIPPARDRTGMHWHHWHKNAHTNALQLWVGEPIMNAMLFVAVYLSALSGCEVLLADVCVLPAICLKRLQLA
jgi:hypothetical protein